MPKSVNVAAWERARSFGRTNYKSYLLLQNKRSTRDVRTHTSLSRARLTAAKAAGVPPCDSGVRSSSRSFFAIETFSPAIWKDQKFESAGSVIDLSLFVTPRRVLESREIATLPSIVDRSRLLKTDPVTAQTTRYILLKQMRSQGT